MPQKIRSRSIFRHGARLTGSGTYQFTSPQQYYGVAGTLTGRARAFTDTGDYTPPAVAETGSVTTFELTSSATTGTYPFTIGMGFADDANGATFINLNIANHQVEVKRRWTSGRIKHAIISGRVALTQNVARTITVSRGAPATGTALTSASIQTALTGANVSVQCGSFGTVLLGNLLATPFRTWISGHEMVECHYRGDVGGSTDLAVFFHVRLYADGRVWVRAVVENGYLDNGSGAASTRTARSYVPTVVIGGTTVYNNGGAALNHYYGSRWYADGWIGGDPLITPKHNVAHLVTTKLVPNYGFGSGEVSTASEAGTPYIVNGGDGFPTLANHPDALAQTYVPMTAPWYRADMSGAGFAPYIGLLPLWDALYIKTGDPRAWRAMLAGESHLNTYNIAFRKRSTKAIPRPSDFTNWWIDGPGAGGNNGTVTPGSTWSWEINHHPSGGYLGYLLTGEYWHYETMAFNASLCYLCPNGAGGSGTSRDVLVAAPRGNAWLIRTISQYCGLAPDAELVNGGVAGAMEAGGDYQQLLAHIIDYWKTRKDQPGFPQFGYIWESVLGGYGTGSTAPWQQHFWMSAMGMGSDIEPLPSMSNYIDVRNFLYRGVVGILGGASGSDYCYTRACSLNGIPINDDNNYDPLTWYTAWPQIYAAAQAYPDITKDPADLDWSTCPTVLKGNSGSSPSAASYGNWGHLFCAISYAVDHGATNAQTAFNRLKSASNWTSTIVNGQSVSWEDVPHLGVTPRNYTPYLPYSLPAAGEVTSIHLNTLTSVYSGAGQYWDIAEKEKGPFITWAGGAFASDYSEYGAMIYWGGGHGGYEGIQHFVFDLSTGMWSEGGSDNNPVDPSFDSSHDWWNLMDTTWADYFYNGSHIQGASHTYSFPAYIPAAHIGNTKGAWIMGGAVWGPYYDHPSGITLGNDLKPHHVDLDTFKWYRTTTNIGPGVNTTGGSAVYDSTRKILWVMPNHDFDPIYKVDFNVAAGSRTIVAVDGAVAGPYYGCTVYVPEADVIFSAGELSGPIKVRLWDPAVMSGVSGSRLVTTNDPNILFSPTHGNQLGVDYCPDNGKFYICPKWHELNNSTLYTLTPPAGALTYANWSTGTWTWGTETATVGTFAYYGEPGAPAGGEIPHNKWKYNRKLKCFMWTHPVTRTSQDGVSRYGAFQLYRPLGVS